MENAFIPIINKLTFEQKVLKFQENEGSNDHVVNTIYEKIKNTNVYKSFLEICKDYNIEFKASQNEESYKITIITNGYDSHSMTYDDKYKDISFDLATILYKELSTQIRNKDFIQNHKNKTK
ncbi:hypothetical protein [Chryseobacterium sp. ERMR1:04]|uniref:hypothetical protein n=1 Tax=Chryseobacterium sp. ERMR1:04 TaxID=1705393 RepID=UPI0006C8641B|nr:hypothetical protein [Chryseobacterium sp. ERMR1:04]KPH11753.1 hypothetical protein AMQ68_20495 [Chryseobacterium sp. ERMR1:04]